MYGGLPSLWPSLRKSVFTSIRLYLLYVWRPSVILAISLCVCLYVYRLYCLYVWRPSVFLAISPCVRLYVVTSGGRPSF